MFMPGCWCCSSCTIFTDDFATDRTGTDYTVSSGSWTVSGGVLTTGSAGALIVENTSGSTGHGRVKATVKVDTSGASVRLVGSYVDSSNYLFVELFINGASSTLKLWKKVSGSDTQLGSTYTFTGFTGTNYALQLCWDGTYATGILGSTTKIIRDSFTGSGNAVGVGASPNGGTATFDDLAFYAHPDDNASCDPCGTPCTSGALSAACSAGGIAVHGATWTDSGTTVSLSSSGTNSNSVYAWCYDWSPGLKAGQVITYKANIAWTGTGYATIGISFGFDFNGSHVCGSAFDSEVPGGHCPGVQLLARLGLGDYAVSVQGSGVVNNIAVTPTSGDLLEIRITCIGASFPQWQTFINGTEYANSIPSKSLPSPLNYRLNSTAADVSASTATWSNISFSIA